MGNTCDCLAKNHPESIQTTPDKKKVITHYNDIVINQAYYAQKLTNEVQHIQISKKPTEQCMILYIEDNQAYHVLMQKIIESIDQNLQLIVVSTISDAIKYIDDHYDEIDLILLDAILDNGTYCVEILDKLIEKNFKMDHVVLVSRLYDKKPELIAKYNISSFYPKPLNILHFKKMLQNIFIY